MKMMKILMDGFSLQGKLVLLLSVCAYCVHTTVCLHNYLCMRSYYVCASVVSAHDTVCILAVSACLIS